MRLRVRILAACVAALSVFSVGSAAAGTGAAQHSSTFGIGKVPKPQDDPFYKYTGDKPLGSYRPGTVLRTRTTDLHLETIPLPVRVVQLQYRTVDTKGNPDIAVTSVYEPNGKPSNKLVSYQSAYDALSPDCQPSYAIAGGFDPGFLATGETIGVPLLFKFLNRGYTVAIPDFEGTKLHFTAGPENGKKVLDSVRAAVNSPDTGLTKDAKVALGGYSGGAIGTEWAAEQAPKYAPDVNARLVLASAGGVFANPIHNAKYIDGEFVWPAVLPMAFVGLARSYGIDIQKYLSPLGKELFAKTQNGCIVGTMADGILTAFLKVHHNLRFSDLTKPRYPKPENIPEVVKVLNDVIMSSHGTPTVPMLFHEGTFGELNGTIDNDKPGIGRGDGVMVAGDVRSVARKYCAAGTPVEYKESPLEHGGDAIPWAVDTVLKLPEAFRGEKPKSNCASIAPGNSLDPIKYEPPAKG
ncbi:lipase family protein [Sciscionella sediminilitoris]|uniref:lipase family protein n=1 Tax=Sciscionella sediminilitoris TaxID=1445613 RepID=UPI0004DFCE14|nr:lipase family protein [Sciscionella sp. SE31]